MYTLPFILIFFAVFILSVKQASAVLMKILKGKGQIMCIETFKNSRVMSMTCPLLYCTFIRKLLKVCKMFVFCLVSQNEEPIFSKDCTTFFITMPLKHGGLGTFNHITMISNQVKLLETFNKMNRFS